MSAPKKIRARGADDYLRLEATPEVYAAALPSLFRGARTIDTEGTTARVSVGIVPVSEVGTSLDVGPVRIKVQNGSASIVGGIDEIAELEDLMRSQLSACPGHHWEILRVFDDAYWWIDSKTHIDMVVVES